MQPYLKRYLRLKIVKNFLFSHKQFKMTGNTSTCVGFQLYQLILF